MAISRRTVLTAGLLGLAATTLAGVGLAVRGSRAVEPVRPLQRVNASEFASLVALAERMVTGEGLDVDPVGIAHGVDDLLTTMDPAAVGEVRTLLGLLESGLAGALLGERLAPFSVCDAATRDAVLDGWAAARIPLLRTGFRGLHGLCMAVAWADTDLYAFVDYPGPPPLHGLLDAEGRP